MKRFTNTGTLFFFALRRNRFFMPIWIVGIAAFTVLCAPLFTQVAKSPAELAMYAETMKNPAMIALCGPLYAEPYTYGVMYTQLMTVWILILIGVMNFFLVARHTRKDEEDGKLEVMRSLPVGRLAITSSTWAVTLLANLLIGLLCAAGLASVGIESMVAGGSFLLGGIFFAVGMFFAATAMLFSQLCSTSHGMIGGSFLTLGIFYLIAAMGNVSGGALSYFSPFSIAFKASPFSGNYIWPVFAILTEMLVIALFAMHLSAKRDLGTGLLPQRHGRAHAQASLSSPFGLAFQLMKKTAAAWIIIMFILGMSYGSVFRDFELFVSESEMLQMIIGTGTGENMILSFMTYVTLIMSLVAAIPVIGCVLKLRSEEKMNRLEPIYARSVSKTGMFLPYIAIALGLSVLLQLALSLSMGLAANIVMEDAISFSDVMLAGLVKLPGIWLFAGISVLLTGLLPKLTSLVWVYFGLSFFTMYISKLAELPEIFIKMSAFGALPNYPTDEFRIVPFVIITAISLALSVIGVIFYEKREFSYV
jgi:Putative exporter of polyketide antibiotics